MATKSEVAQKVLSGGLQSWGQSIDEQVKAWQAAYDFMCLSVTLGVGEANGREIFTFEGADAEQAVEFMREVSMHFPLGKFEKEQEMIESCLEKYGRAKMV